MMSLYDHAERMLADGHVAQAVTLVEGEALLGNAEALRQLAEWRLIGYPLLRDLPLARTLFQRAREGGDVPATRAEIALMANGSGAASDWNGALALLEQLAMRDESAAKDFALLDAMTIDAMGMPLGQVEVEQLADQPFIWRYRHFLTREECLHIAQAALPLLEPSMVADPRTGQNIQHPIRTSSAAIIGPTRETMPIQAIQRRIASTTQTSVMQGEPFAVLHYAPGQQYRRHMDALPNEANQRVKTAILYLNEGYVGGGTHFPACNITVKAKGGDLIIFDNVTADGVPDPASVHAGLPVESGAKWVATRWIRARPLNIWAPR